VLGEEFGEDDLLGEKFRADDEMRLRGFAAGGSETKDVEEVEEVKEVKEVKEGTAHFRMDFSWAVERRNLTQRAQRTQRTRRRCEARERREVVTIKSSGNAEAAFEER
jgi:hypothetical protein